jgi:exonuclease SbcC
MKINKLTIHNIASIEDATIDFSSEALSREGLFLICGPTGAGKTTILDAISIALFNTTPRFERSENERFDSTTEGSESTKDLQNIMRRNSVEAYIKLEFEGIDGTLYKSVWSIRRSGSTAKNFDKKTLEEQLSAHIMAPDWTVTDLKTGKEYIGKRGTKGDPTSSATYAIERAVGMTFDQFCRTTMLAQGDFTKFLTSKHDEKSLILEKLTGTDIYARVGAKINENMLARKRDYEIKWESLQNVIGSLLNEEQIGEKRAAISDMRTELNALGKNKKEMTDKLNWLNTRDNLRKELQEKLAVYEQAKADDTSEQSRTNARLIEDWDATSDVRIGYANKCDAQKALEESKNEAASLQMNFQQALAGVNYLHKVQTSTDGELKECNDFIEHQRQFEEMFSNATTLQHLLQTMAQAEQKIANSTREKKAKQTLIEQQQNKLKQQQEAVQQTTERIAALKTQIDEAQRQLRSAGADTLTQQLEQLNTRNVALINAQKAVEEWQKAVRTLQQTSENARKQTELIAALETQLKTLTTAVDVAKQRYDKSKILLDKTQESVADFAKEARKKLQIGDHCPVCGKVVDGVLSDDNFISVLEPIEKQYAEDEKSWTDAKDEMGRKASEVQSAQRLLGTYQTNERDDKFSADKAQKKAQEECDVFGLSINDNPLGQIAALQKSNNEQLHAANAKQQEVNGIRAQMDELQKQVNRCSDLELTPQNKAVEDTKSAITKLNTAVERCSTVIDEAAKQQTEAKASFAQLANPDWKPMEQTRYAEELLQAAKAYTDALSRQQALTTSLENTKGNIENAEELVHNVVTIFPEWAEIHSSEIVEYTLLRNKLNDLHARCSSLKNAISTYTRTVEQSDVQINQFLTKHDDISIQRLIELSRYSLTQINEVRGKLQAQKEHLATTLGAKNDAEKKLNAHESQRPEMSDTDTVDLLSSALERADDKIKTISENIGSLEAALKADSENRQRSEKEKQEIDRMEADYQNWKALDDKFGTKDGQRFRDIAQSFVLQELLDAANEYLLRISDRYQLFCNPANLTILLHDAYQGGVQRPTNTLSGGESFIVSLALALGLSSMKSAGFEVDTLFIDEGFGTLSPEFLDPVLNALKRLYQTSGRRVGIISHVEALKSRIPVTIEVSKIDSSRSKVEVCGV